MARVLRELPAAEVILTFGADSLINHLSLTDQIIKPLARLELSNAQIEQLIENRASLNMMGWDPLREPLPSLPLFSFKDLDRETMLDDLLNTLPNELFAYASDAPVAVETVHRQLANRTAASFADLDEIVLRLRQEGEVRILRPDGKARSRSLKRLRPTDRIAFPDTLLLPVISRRR